MYGGSNKAGLPAYSPDDGSLHDDVWALSIPSFRWISINDTNNGERNANGMHAGRTGHTCNMWQESQMIVIGGWYASDATTEFYSGGALVNKVCETTYNAIRLLDTSTYTWQTQYTPNSTEYKVPSAVYGIIGGE